MTTFSIACWDADDRSLLHEVVQNAENAFEACQLFSAFWELITEICKGEALELPTTLEELSELADSFSLEVSVIQVVRA